MAQRTHDYQRLTRRALLKGLGLAPLLLRASPFCGALGVYGELPRVAERFPLADARLVPHYPARSPLEDVLRLVEPGSDEYVTEKYAYQIAAILQRWSQAFKSGDLLVLADSLDPSMQAAPLLPTRETPLRRGPGIESSRREFSSTLAAPGSASFLEDLRKHVLADAPVERAEFEITAIEVVNGGALTVQLAIRYDLVASQGNEGREQRTGTWHTEWTQHEPLKEAAVWKLTRFRADPETRSVAHGPIFVDVTQHALGGALSYAAQMVHGADHWRTVLDGACGIDIYGNNGVAAGDYDNDGLDDLYISQPAGLPNRLYRNRGDGTFDDVTEKAGVGVLDNTACALFADFRNCGLQDLLVVCGTGPLLFLNGGDGTFIVKRDAFQFAHAPQGTFTHAAVADYDRDGKLDIYFCVYSYYLGLDQYHYPVPYYDARNGPPNFLFHNEGDASFADRTEAAGLNVDNDRYSFACAWGESLANGAPDLYVVNDFGRNNFYRSNGKGTFVSSSTQTHVEDVGAGMSACWADYNNDGRPDLYVANMWSAAGQRVSQQARFHEKTAEATRDLYRQHAHGNTLYRNQGEGVFANVSSSAGVEMGRWAWCSDFWDFDHDGYPDLYVTNGYISPPGQPDTGFEKPLSDLGSFFWRQVVGKSPEDATPSLAYERGWNALNELIRSDHAWSGYERNVFYANHGDGTFSDISGVAGLDFLEDGRSFALADLDHDGRLEVILKNRNGPQLRILHNSMQAIGDSIAFRLRGTQSNRDAIGTAVTLVAGGLRQTKYLQAGSGFLAQHTKEVFFGIGKPAGADPSGIRATVRWPSGLTQHFNALPRNSRISLVEGATDFTSTLFGPSTLISTHAAPPSAPPPQSIGTWLLDPLKAPDFSLIDLAGRPQTLEALRGRFVLLHFWGTASPLWREQLRLLQAQRASFAAHQLSILAVNVDEIEEASRARLLASQENLAFPILFASEEVAGVYNIIYRYLFDRRRDLGVPTSFLLDQQGMIVKLYQGVAQPDVVVDDLRSMPDTAAERVRRALPFAGTMYAGAFKRNDFTYGVAMFQHGYLDQAAASFEQVVTAKPKDAEGFYNLGTLSLRRNDLPKARLYLEKTLQLRPDYPEAWNNLGMIAAQQGDAEEAIRSFRQSLLQRPTYAIALLNLGNLYRRQKDFVQAQECLRQALDLQADDPETNYSMGMLYAQQNQLQPAATYLTRAVSLRPDYPEALNNLGVLSVRQQEYAIAEQQFKTCIRLAPRFDQSYINLARLYVLQHDKPKAKLALEELLRVQPESAPAREGLEVLQSMP